MFAVEEIADTLLQKYFYHLITNEHHSLERKKNKFIQLPGAMIFPTIQFACP